MRVLDETARYGGQERRSAVTIGVFDGVHRGHQVIIQRCVREAAERGIPSVLLTFDVNPKQVVRGENPCVISAQEMKMELIETLGIDCSIVTRFDENLASMEPEEFCREVLVRDLGAASVCVGENFRFGKGGRGDVTALAGLGSEMGFAVIVVPLVRTESGLLSSTLVRGLIMEGKVWEVIECLGRPYALSGEVVEGHLRGRGLGFPTANLRMSSDYCVPRDGVYAGKATVGENLYSCAVNVGENPTFGDGVLAIEVYLIDFDDDIYGASMEVEFHHRIRGEIAFDDQEQLIEQMKKDVSTVESLLEGD